MKRIMSSIILLTLLLTVSCKKDKPQPQPQNPNDPNNPNEPFLPSSVKEQFVFLGTLPMQEGPHQLLIANDYLYALRDNKIFLFSIDNPGIPELLVTYEQENNKNFGKMFLYQNDIWVPNLENRKIYVFDAALNLKKTYNTDMSYFNPNVMIIEGNNYWIGGSDSTHGILARCTLNGNTLKKVESWESSLEQTFIESLGIKGNYIFTSLRKGDLLSFSKSNLAAGPKSTLTYDNEQGYEKSGRTILMKENQVFWVNGGAGFANVNAANPENMILSSVLTNSMIRSQIKQATEGTDVYDVAYNEKRDLLCVANGWSGVLLIKPGLADVVQDYMDPQYFQNYSIATTGDYFYIGNVSGGINNNLKGIAVFKFK